MSCSRTQHSAFASVRLDSAALWSQVIKPVCSVFSGQLVGFEFIWKLYGWPLSVIIYHMTSRLGVIKRHSIKTISHYGFIYWIKKKNFTLLRCLSCVNCHYISSWYCANPLSLKCQVIPTFSSKCLLPIFQCIRLMLKIRKMTFKDKLFLFHGKL